MGTEGEDHVARSGPVVVDSEGNAVVYGNTNGNLYRDREVGPSHDLFVIHFDEADGYFEPTKSGDVAGLTIHLGAIPEPEGVEEDDEVDASMDDESPPNALDVDDDSYTDEEGPVEEPPAEGNLSVENNEDQDAEGPEDEGMFQFDKTQRIVYGIVLGLLAIVLVACLIRRTKRTVSNGKPGPAYDAAANDLGYDYDPNASRGGGGLGIFGKKSPAVEGKSPESGRNLNYRDDPDNEGDTGDMGNFHRTYEPTA